MKVDLNKPTRAKAGDILHIRCSIPKGVEEQARVEIYSAVGNYEHSPHVPVKMLGTLFDGKPAMLQPTRVVLHSQRTNYEFVIPVEEDDSSFIVKQEVDSLTDLKAKVKVLHYGQARQRINRILRRTFGFMRLRTDTDLR